MGTEDIVWLEESTLCRWSPRPCMRRRFCRDRVGDGESGHHHRCMGAHSPSLVGCAPSRLQTITDTSWEETCCHRHGPLGAPAEVNPTCTAWSSTHLHYCPWHNVGGGPTRLGEGRERWWRRKRSGGGRGRDSGGGVAVVTGSQRGLVPWGKEARER